MDARRRGWRGVRAAPLCVRPLFSGRFSPVATAERQGNPPKRLSAFSLRFPSSSLKNDASARGCRVPPLKSQCNHLHLARRGLAKPWAPRARLAAAEEHIVITTDTSDCRGKPYVRGTHHRERGGRLAKARERSQQQARRRRLTSLGPPGTTKLRRPRLVQIGANQASAGAGVRSPRRGTRWRGGWARRPAR